MSNGEASQTNHSLDGQIERCRQYAVGQLRDRIQSEPILTFRPLTAADVKFCVALENEAFAKPEYPCSPEKVRQSVHAASLATS